MTKTRINGPVLKTVVLGSKHYSDRLTVTAAGSIDPAAYGAPAVMATMTGVTLTNRGAIMGGVGSSMQGAANPNGGIGVDLAAGGVIRNSGTIAGGTGGNPFYPAHYGNGGNAIDTAGGSILSNGGSIIGGAVYFSTAHQNSATGGIGVHAEAALKIVNTGLIAGGDNEGGQAGAGIRLDARGTIYNDGKIVGGGTGNYYAGSGVILSSGGTLFNRGSIDGGATRGFGFYPGGLGGAGIDATNAYLSNYGTVTGGFGYGAGGAGVGLNNSTLKNVGLVTGGAGIRPAAGVYAKNGAAITNSGTITGGLAFNTYEGAVLHPAQATGHQVNHYVFYSAPGVALTAGCGLYNTGTIAGGAGSPSEGTYSASGRNGGIGVTMTGAATAINHGVIAGGAGGDSNYQGRGAFGGYGGAGVSITGGGTFTNAGTITGGNGGTAFETRPDGYGGYGGAGVILNGGTLIDSGTIGGGIGGSGSSGAGANGAAVQFGSAAGTLQIAASAIFNGLVTANADVRDVLMLTAGAAGTLTGLGTEFVDFTTITENAGATWTLTGANALSAGSALLDAGTLAVSGTLTDDGAATISGAGKLQATSSGTVLLQKLTLTGGTAAAAAAAKLVIGSAAAGAVAGDITVNAGTTVSGFGTLAAAAGHGIVDLGNITASGGILALASSVSGPGTVFITSGATASVQAVLGNAMIRFAANAGATLQVGAHASVTGKLIDFAHGDTIDEKRVITSVSYTGGTLTLLDGTSAVGTLFLAGDHATGDFLVQSDGQGGTAITLRASGAAEYATDPDKAALAAARDGAAWKGGDHDLLFGLHFHGG